MLKKKKPFDIVMALSGRFGNSGIVHGVAYSGKANKKVKISCLKCLFIRSPIKTHNLKRTVSIRRNFNSKIKTKSSPFVKSPRIYVFFEINTFLSHSSRKFLHTGLYPPPDMRCEVIYNIYILIVF